ncbi:MAG: T9SS type A sorting domain-containing protein, partial [Bacteroidetes bacterium]|nr:T9SS type A sorting domain-containing protein [Bacteroidota bacterium]
FKAYPNPFSSATNISYQLLNNSQVKVQIFDLNGKLIQTLVDENKKAGNYIEFFNGNEFPEGIYIYRIETDLGSQTGKLILH